MGEIVLNGKLSIISGVMEKTCQTQKNKRDELFDEAVEIISKQKTCSPAILQRRLGVGYVRAGRILEQMENAGIVGPESGTNREVLMKLKDKSA